MPLALCLPLSLNSHPLGPPPITSRLSSALLLLTSTHRRLSHPTCTVRTSCRDCSRPLHQPGLVLTARLGLPQAITPPKTRKRKAADIVDTTPPPDASPSSALSGPKPFKLKLTRASSNKADDSPASLPVTLPVTVTVTGPPASATATSSSTAESKHAPSAIHTPASTKMESEDDMMSVSSGGAFDAIDDSDIGASDDDFGLDEEPDDLGLQDKDLKPSRKAFEVPFRVFAPSDIQKYQDSVVEEVSNILDQPPENTAILLRHARWNKEKLIENYMDREDKVLNEAGLGRHGRTRPQLEIVPGFVCDICVEDGPDLQTYAMRCGHRFCVDCYKHYLSQKIREEGEAARIKCPGQDCSIIIDSKSLDLLLASDLRHRYQELLTRTYVDDKENLKWCPAPNCVYAVDCAVKPRDLGRVVPTVTCKCGHPFCFGCTLADHQPAPCGLVKKWMKKCADDSETANWISANTKECPKCNSTIEKNGGCNHMTCRKCRHEFCWICMGLWSEHGTSWYNCNRYEERSGFDARDAQAKSRASLERYLHYYNRYANHEQSAKLDKDIAIKAEKKMTKLQTDSNLSWIEVQFLKSASSCLQECRQTLKWTYAFAFYLARNNQTEIFEDNQKDLEMAVENLSEMFEKPTDQLKDLKVDMMDKISYCSKRRVILLDTTATTLLSGGWKFNTDFGK